ncbi:uncharacterized protein LOC143152130 isoform X2 [Ptiloglossa arizonensis]|uniref:uncharacterized protein LOC143152130 isoform X2 n=1 Tax=Ptiloglossa arizonensis TaxID=3350558 RepID=UPI003FA0844A
MVIQRIVILLPLVTQVLSAPSGCIECNLYIKHFQTGTQAPGSVQDHNGLTQTSARLQGLDYSRPGTWSEHNNYNTDNGYGKVHEEQGQYVTGPKTIRYYTKNYSSYSSGYPNAVGLSKIEQDNYRHGYIPNTEENFNSQRAYDLIGNTQSIAQHDYNKIQNRQYTQSSVRRINTQSERLEDFGESGGNSQVIQQGTSNLNTQIIQEPSYTNVQPGNWSKVNSYGTNGGNGRVFEEEGQFVSGPKKVRYYRKNFTSSSGSSNSFAIPEVSEIELQDVLKKVEVIQKPSTIAQTNINTYGLASDNLHNINSNTHREQIDYGSSLSTMQHNEGQHFTDIVNGPYRSPSKNTYGTNNFNIYERHEGYVSQIKPSSQFVNPTSRYSNVHSTGNSGYNRNMYSGGTIQQQTDNLQQTELLDSHQSTLVHDQIIDDNLRQNVYNQNNPITLGTPRQVSHYKEHRTSSHRRETLLPQYSADRIHINEQSGQYNNKHTENSFNTAHQTLDKMMTEALGEVGHNTDCKHGTEEHTHTSSQYHRKYKRSPEYYKLSDIQQQQTQRLSQQNMDSSIDANVDLLQQTSKLDDLTQQTSGKLEFGQQSQQSYQPWRPGNNNQQSEDLTQQTSNSDDLTQQTSGRLELGQQSQQSYQRWRPGNNNQQSQYLTQQTSGRREFGQQSQQSYQTWRPGNNNQQSEDLTQQTSNFDDLTQQTSGRLELGQQSQQSYQRWRTGNNNQQSQYLTQQTSGRREFGQQSQQSYQPWRPGNNNQQLEDLTQQTRNFDDLTQQTSGRLELGQQSQQSYQHWRPGNNNQQSQYLTQQTSGRREFGQQSEQSYQRWRPGNNNQQSQDLTRQTRDSDDLTQQTSGKLEFGQQSQQSYQPWRPSNKNQRLEDLTQQTGEFDDLTQQTSGKLEFGQQSEDLTQQTSDSDDLTQQTSGKLELGQQSQNSDKPWRPGHNNEQSEDLNQQTGEFDDLTQQTSGKLEYGQQSQNSDKPWRPGNKNEQSEDLTQQTGEFDDLTQQTSGKLEFGQQSEDLTQQTGEFDDLTQQTSGKLEFGQQSQQSYQPWRPGNKNQRLEDLTQQTGEFDDLTQQTSGKLEFGQQSEDLTQQTSVFDDLTQQTSGKLELGQQSQNSDKPWRPGHNNEQSEDLTQQTGEFDDLTQQTSGKLEFGQRSQNSDKPWGPVNKNEQSEDLTQQTGEFDDLTQQTSGKLEFGQQSEDLTQQTSDFDDLTQPTSGKLELGQQSQNSDKPWRPDHNNEQSEDLTQQTGEFDDLTQQTSGKLEFGQQSQNSDKPWGPVNKNEQSEDLTQQTGEFDDLTQQTSGKLEFGQQSEDLTQQTSDFDDLTQQTSGKLELGQQSQNSDKPWRPGHNDEQSEDLTQQTGEFDDLTQQTSGKLEFGQQSQNSDKPWRPVNKNEQSEDLTQQTGKFDDLTQQTSGKLEFGQQSEDLTQQTSDFDDLTQQTSGKLELGQQSQNSYQPWWPNNQQSGDFTQQTGKLVHIPLFSNSDRAPKSMNTLNSGNNSWRHENLSQLSNVYDVNGQQLNQQQNEDLPTEQQISSVPLPKPLGKPKPRSRYSRIGILPGLQIENHNTDNSNSQQTSNANINDTSIVNIYKLPPKIVPESDVHNTRDQITRGDQSTNNFMNKNSLKPLSRELYNIEGANMDQERTDQSLLESQVELSQQAISDTYNRQKQVPSNENKHSLESRILEVYGGGPYDASHSDDIYSGITINPNAALPPIDNVDPWDIREKPKEVVLTTSEVIPTPIFVEPLNENDKTIPLPSFWSRVGNKITTTFDKAKEKARTIFG